MFYEFRSSFCSCLCQTRHPFFCSSKVNNDRVSLTVFCLVIRFETWDDVFAGCFVGLMTYTVYFLGVWTICHYWTNNTVYQRVLMKPCLWLKLIRHFVTVVHTQQIKLLRNLMVVSLLLFMTAKLALSLLHWYIYLSSSLISINVFYYNDSKLMMFYFLGLWWWSEVVLGYCSWWICCDFWWSRCYQTRLR